MSKYVKFMHGTPAAFEALQSKDKDTLYFISEADAAKGSLYLGDKQIVCDSSSEEIQLALSDLSDVQITELISDGDILSYHIGEDGEYWTATSLNDLAVIPEIGVDNVSIVQNDANLLMLKDYGKKYYKYVPATEDAEATYVELVVDASNPWKAGLEPKVALENGQLVLAWYEPSLNTVDGLEAEIAELAAAVADRYTKAEVDSAIAKVDHLSRKVVTSIDDIDLIADNADKFIYLVPNGDIYDEYMVIEGKLEKVGDWSVNLDEYAKTADILVKSVNEEQLNVSEEGLLSLKPIAHTSIQGLGDNYVSKIEFNTAVGDLSKLTEKFGADANLIDTVLELEQRLTWGELTI